MLDFGGPLACWLLASKIILYCGSVNNITNCPGFKLCRLMLVPHAPRKRQLSQEQR